jgi:hypothetical protein
MTTDGADNEKSPAAEPASAAKEFDWFDRPASRRFLWRLLYGACIVVVLLEIPLIIGHLRHSHFESHGGQGGHGGVPTFDGWWFFYAGLGFIGCALMILAAKGLGYVLKKPTDYYGDDSRAEGEALPEDIDEALR